MNLVNVAPEGISLLLPHDWMAMPQQWADWLSLQLSRYTEHGVDRLCIMDDPVKIIIETNVVNLHQDSHHG